MSRIKQVQDYLTEVEEYLKKTLADEKLSPAAQIKRRHLLDRFYALDLQANDNRNPLGSTVSHCKSAITINGTSSPQQTSSGKPQHDIEPRANSKALPEPPMEEDDSMYNLYEEPVLYSTMTAALTAPATTVGGASSTNRIGTTGSGKISETVYAQAEECSDTEYESFDDDDDDDNSYNSKSQRSSISYQLESRASREVPLPLVRKNSSNDMDLLSRLPNVLYSGKLYQKGLLSWLKRFYIISDSRLLAFRSCKHFRPLLVLDLVGCDVEYVARDNSKYRHALKISRPIAGEGISHLGGGTLASSIHSSNMNNEVNSCWFYASEREIIDIWIHHLCLGGCVRVTDDKTPDCCLDTITIDADSGVCDNQTNISGGSSEGGSGDGVTSVNTGLERKPSSCTIHSASSSSSSGVGASFRKKLKLGESLQSLLMGPFSSKGRQKDDRIRKAFIDAGGMEAADLPHVAGYVNVSSDLSEGQGRWSKRFCVARQGRLDCYKDPLDETIEFSVPLKGCSIAEADKQTKRIVLYCETSSGEKVEVDFEMFNMNDFGKWLVLVIRETGYRLDMDSREPIITESVYNEVYDWPVYGPSADVQPPPLPKERPLSRVIFTTEVEGTRESHSIPLLSDGGKSLPVIAEDNIFGEEFIDKDGSFHLEEIMASAFDNIKKTINDAAGKKESEVFSNHSNPSGSKSTPSSSNPPCLSFSSSSSSSKPSTVSSSKPATVLLSSSKQSTVLSSSSSLKATTISLSISSSTAASLSSTAALSSSTAPLSSSTAPLLSSLYSKPITSTSSSSSSSATTMASSSRKELLTTKPFNELASRYPTLFSSATSTFISNASLPSSSTSSPATSRSKPTGTLAGAISVTRRCMVTAAEEKGNSLPNLRKSLRSSSVPPRSTATNIRLQSEKIDDSANNNNNASPKKQSVDFYSSPADPKCTSRTSASATAKGLSSNRNSSFVHSSVNMANLKNEINKRNSMYNYNLSNSSSSNNNNIYKVFESKADKVGGSFVTLPSRFQPQKLTVTTTATNSKAAPVLVTTSATATPLHMKGTSVTGVSSVTESSSSSSSSCKPWLSASTTTTATTSSSIYKTLPVTTTSIDANTTAATTSAIITTASTTATMTIAVKQQHQSSTSVPLAVSVTTFVSAMPSATSLVSGNILISTVNKSTTKDDTTTATTSGGKNVAAGNGGTNGVVKSSGTTGGVEIGKGGLRGSGGCSSSSSSSSSISSSVGKKVKTFSPDRTNSDLVSKRSSFVALSTLTTSNSKLREARAEIRKSSLELMSILPSTAARQHLLLDRNMSDGAVATTTITTTTASLAVAKQI